MRCQFILAMGGKVYCRTCAAPPEEIAAKGMINIFANVQLIELLSTLKEWKLDIMQDDDLPQCICKKCEMALNRINSFRAKALRAKEYLQMQFRTFMKMTENQEGICDNENDLGINYDNEVGMYYREAIPITCEFETKHLNEKLILVNNNNNNNNANEKPSGQVKQPQISDFETSTNAVHKQIGELLFDSNIESSKPPEFQVVLIEEEYDTQLQWINEDEHEGERVSKSTENVTLQTEWPTVECEKCEGVKKNNNNESNKLIKHQRYISNTCAQNFNINELKGEEEEVVVKTDSIKIYSMLTQLREIHMPIQQQQQQCQQLLWQQQQELHLRKHQKQKQQQQQQQQFKSIHLTNKDNQKEKLLMQSKEHKNKEKDLQKINSKKKDNEFDEENVETLQQKIQSYTNKYAVENCELLIHEMLPETVELLEKENDEAAILGKNISNNLLEFNNDGNIYAQFDQSSCAFTETTLDIPKNFNSNTKNAELTDDEVQLREFQAFLTAINEQVSPYETIKETNNYLNDDLDLQSIFMNDLTLQMINANVNIVEEDLQLDELETLLAAIDEKDSKSCMYLSSKQESSKSESLYKHETILDTKISNYENYEHTGLQHEINNSNCENSLEKYEDSGISMSPMVFKKTPSNVLDQTICNEQYIDKKNTKPLLVEQNNVLIKKTNDKRRQNKNLKINKNKKNTNLHCRFCIINNEITDGQLNFVTKQQLDEHITMVHDDTERPYNCPYCAARYRTRSGCVAHINAIHLKKFDNCKLCNKIVTGGTGQMRMHIERNHTHGNYTCEICKIELKNISLYNFKYHKRWHDEGKLLRCDQCDKAFVTRTHLLAHQVTHTHQGDFLCTRCGKSTRSKWELRAHIYAIHGEGEAPLKCNYCDEKFTQHIQRRAHMERYHPNELTTSKRTVPCTKCEKQFTTEIHLQRHMKKQHHQQHEDMRNCVDGEVTKVAPPPTTLPQYEGFMCAHCPRKYRSKYVLIKHLKVHTKMPDKPYSCPDCHMHFKHFSELDRHDLQHHATIRPYRCDECSKRFSTRTALRIHHQIHEVKCRNFRCPECNQRFKFEKAYSLHRASHKTMRHSCDICDKSYIRLSQLKTHKHRYHKMQDEE